MGYRDPLLRPRIAPSDSVDTLTTKTVQRRKKGEGGRGKGVRGHTRLQYRKIRETPSADEPVLPISPLNILESDHFQLDSVQQGSQ